MKAFWCLFIVLLFFLLPMSQGVAQDDFVAGEILSRPQCFNVVNKAPYNVYGSITTNVYITPEGIKARHRSNFRLQENEQVEFCASGPFYDGRKVELTLRTLVPIFSCKTKMTGDVLIKGRKKPEGGTETWAECL